MESIETINYKGYSINIAYDTDAMNPRKEFDNLGTILTQHRRYRLGDEQTPELCESMAEIIGLTPEQYNRLYDTQNGYNTIFNILLTRMRGSYIVLPVYLYDHSGLTINTTGFTCPWDSGLIGIIYVSKERARAEYSVKRITRKWVNRIEDYLRGEIETYNDYLTGNVYYYTIENPVGEEIDSCGGFYGDNHEVSGLLEYARNAVNCDITDTVKSHLTRLRGYILNKVPLIHRVSCPL